MKKIIHIFLISAVILFISSCDKTTPPSSNEMGFDIEEMKPGETFSLESENVDIFTLSDSGEIYIVSKDKQLARYSRDGEFIEEYSDVPNLSSIYFYDNKIFAYDTIEKKIISYDLNDKIKTYVSEKIDLNIFEIKDFFVIGDTALLLFIAADEDGHYHPSEETDENGYIDYEEQLYSINLSTGKVKNLKEKNIISMYKGSDETLYYYSYTNKNYELYSVNISNGKKEIISTMNDIGYIFAFIYEANNFTYIDPNYNLINKRLSDGFSSTLEMALYAGLGKNVYFHNGHFIYRKSPTYTNGYDPELNYTVSSKYIGYLYNNDAESVTDDSENDLKYLGENLTISSWQYYSSLDFKNLRTATGISGTLTDPLLDDVLFLTQILAGDENVDIFILNSSNYLTFALKDKSFYTPLNNSQPINNYIDGCFDYIKDSVKTENGDIYLFPLIVNANAIFYVEENLEHFDISYNDLKYFDQFLQTLEKLNGKTNDFYVYGDSVNNFFYGCFFQYDMFYNDYSNKNINFNTDLFKKIFTKLWGGWDRRKNPNGNVLFKTPYNDVTVNHENGLSTFPAYDSEKVVFKIETIIEHLDPDFTGDTEYIIDKWRAFPFPRISEDIKNNNVTAKYALINPNSKKKDIAIKYLEAITKDPHNLISDPCFTQENIETYKSKYDTSLPVFNEVYDIVKNSKIYFSFTPGGTDDYIDKYQQGQLNAEDAIAVNQREVEMWLNE